MASVIPKISSHHANMIILHAHLRAGTKPTFRPFKLCRLIVSPTPAKVQILGKRWSIRLFEFSNLTLYQPYNALVTTDENVDFAPGAMANGLASRLDRLFEPCTCPQYIHYSETGLAQHILPAFKTVHSASTNEEIEAIDNDGVRDRIRRILRCKTRP